MKTLKFLTVICIALGFCTASVNAQPADIGRDTFPFCEMLPCMNEMACGEMTWCWVFNNNLSKISYFGKMTGESGTDYRLVEIENGFYILNKSEVNQWRSTFLIHANGKPIAKLHATFHITLNANGEETAIKMDDFTIECL